MSDYISRQAVVDVICGMHIGGKDGVANALQNTYGADLREIIGQIDSLPSAYAVPVEFIKKFKKKSRGLLTSTYPVDVAIDMLLNEWELENDRKETD